ncbi:unnamed protein product [Scytosiphon promiscuus]
MLLQHRVFSDGNVPGGAATASTPSQQHQAQQSAAGGLGEVYSSSGQSTSSSPSRPRVEGGPFSGSGLGASGMGSRYATASGGGATDASPARYRGDQTSCGSGGGNDDDMVVGDTVINGSYFGGGVPASSGGNGAGGGGTSGVRAPHSRQMQQQRQQQQQQTHAAHHLYAAHSHETPVGAVAIPSVRGHRPRNSSASCGSYSAIANDGSLVVVGGIGAGGSGRGGGFLNQPPPPPVLTTDFEPSAAARQQRNLSLPAGLREGGGQAFGSTTPLSAGGLDGGGGGYFAAPVTTSGGGGSVAPGGGGDGGRTGRCSGEEAYATQGDEMFCTPQRARGKNAQQGKGGSGFSFPPGVSAGGGGPHGGGSVYVTPRSTPRHVDINGGSGSVSVDAGDGRRGAYGQEFSQELDGFEVGIDPRQGGSSSRGSFRGAPPPSAAAATAAAGAGPPHGAKGAAWPTLDTGRETWSY